MSKIRIRNFGPIKEGYQQDDGFMDIKNVTVFIGNQGSGKSTVAKVISTLTWLEKAINRGDVKKEDISFNQFLNYFEYQRIKNYFRKETKIDYEGEAIKLSYNSKIKQPNIQRKNSNNYKVPKIMYVPAERNLLSAVDNPYSIKNLPDTLYTFAEEMRKGQLEIKDELLELPISDLKFKYKRDNDISYLVGSDYELNLLESSSGYQSYVPLYLVTKFLSDELQKGETILREQLSVEQSVRRNREIADVMFSTIFSESEKNSKVKEIDTKYLNTCFINIVEEPEQNLFPSSQQKMLNSLLEFNNRNAGNKLIMTTHSPYLINYLTLAVEGNYVKEKVKTEELENKLKKIIPLESTVNPHDLVIYELEEKDGTIKLLANYKGLPSDENKLNDELGEGNESFARLLEIE